MRTIPTSNCTRFAAKPLTRGGTPVPVWLAALDRGALPPLDLSGCPGLVVVAPHPDDETLGLGATIAQLVASGVDVQVVYDEWAAQTALRYLVPPVEVAALLQRIDHLKKIRLLPRLV